jgi:hypothetical protein
MAKQHCIQPPGKEIEEKYAGQYDSYWMQDFVRDKVVGRVRKDHELREQSDREWEEHRMRKTQLPKKDDELPFTKGSGYSNSLPSPHQGLEDHKLQHTSQEPTVNLGKKDKPGLQCLLRGGYQSQLASSNFIAFPCIEAGGKPGPSKNSVSGSSSLHTPNTDPELGCQKHSSADDSENDSENDGEDDSEGDSVDESAEHDDTIIESSERVGTLEPFGQQMAGASSSKSENQASGKRARMEGVLIKVEANHDELLEEKEAQNRTQRRTRLHYRRATPGWNVQNQKDVFNHAMKRPLVKSSQLAARISQGAQLQARRPAPGFQTRTQKSVLDHAERPPGLATHPIQHQGARSQAWRPTLGFETRTQKSILNHAERSLEVATHPRLNSHMEATPIQKASINPRMQLSKKPLRNITAGMDTKDKDLYKRLSRLPRTEKPPPSLADPDVADPSNLYDTFKEIPSEPSDAMKQRALALAELRGGLAMRQAYTPQLSPMPEGASRVFDKTPELMARPLSKLRRNPPTKVRTSIEIYDDVNPSSEFGSDVSSKDDSNSSSTESLNGSPSVCEGDTHVSFNSNSPDCKGKVEENLGTGHGFLSRSLSSQHIDLSSPTPDEVDGSARGLLPRSLSSWHVDLSSPAPEEVGNFARGLLPIKVEGAARG